MKVATGWFHGHTEFSRTISGFQLAEAMYDHGLVIPQHAHEHAFFSIMLEGSCTEDYQNRKRSLDLLPLLCRFFPADAEHSHVIHASGARFFFVDIGPELIDRAREDSVKLEEPLVLRGKAFERIGYGLLHEAHRFDEVSPLAVEGLVLNMVAEAARSSDLLRDRRPPRWFRRASELLNERFAEPLTIKMIADEVGIHPVTLSSAFQRYYNCTLGNYVRQLRIAYACRELIETDTPLSDIALAAGFCDQSHFSRLFKDFTGASPSQFRSNCDRRS